MKSQHVRILYVILKVYVLFIRDKADSIGRYVGWSVCPNFTNKSQNNFMTQCDPSFDPHDPTLTLGGRGAMFFQN